MQKQSVSAKRGSQGNWLKILVAAWLCFCLCASLGLQARAAAPAEPLVKVGYDVTGVLLRKTDQGIYRGYNVEFLYEIAKYTGWNYQFVPYNTWDGALKALAAGEIDILPTVLKSPQREKEMLFANHWMGMIHVALVVPADDRTHFYGDLESLQGMRIGVRRNTKDAADVVKWAQEVGLKYQLAVYGDNKELLEALDAGKVDAAGLSYIGRARKYRAIMEFAPQEMYFAVAPQKPQLKVQLDSALGQIAALNPEFYADAMEKLTGRETNPLPVFSQKESAFINAGQPVRITFLRQAAPFSYVDDSGAYQGLLPKLLARVTALSGLKFTYVVVENPAAALKAVQEGRADVVGRITNNLFFARQEHLRLTTPYTYLPLVQVTRPETQKITKVGMQEHCQMDLIQDQECVEKKDQNGKKLPAGTDKQFQLYPTPEELFKALKDGSVDAIYCDAVTAGHLMEMHGTTKFKQAVLQPFTYSFTLGVGPRADTRLAGILDKSIRCISVKEVEEMFIQSRVERTATVRNLLERLPMAYAAGFTVFLLALVAGLAVALLSLRRQSREKLAVMEQAAATRQDKLRMEALEKSVEEKNRFFANISHDMRTPLNAIIGLSLLARSEQVSGKVKDYLDKIQASGNLLLGLINDTLNISKLSSGKVALKQEPVASADIFNDVVVPIREAAAAKQIQFTADRSGLTCDYLLADRLNLEKILLNLLTNAIKYTQAGGQVEFTLAGEETAARKQNLVITVRDNGIGIAPEFLPHLYDAFSQEEDSNAGTGLGMAIVKRLIDLMEGTIQVDSVKGQGTTFTVRLPLQPVAAPDSVAEVSALTQSQLDRLAGKKVLLCEDNELNRQIATALLQKQGMTVVTATDGRQGVDIFSASREHEFAVLLMDVRMPVMDGLMATAAIRALNRRDADVPVVAMTANTFPEDIQACLNVGMNGHVAKPVDPNHLYETLLQVLGE